MVSSEYVEEAHQWWDIRHAGKNGAKYWKDMNIRERSNVISAYSERILSDKEFLTVGDYPKKHFWEQEMTDDEKDEWELNELKKKWQKEADAVKEWKIEEDPIKASPTINPRGSLPTGFTINKNDLEKWHRQESEKKKEATAAQKRKEDQQRREKELEDEMIENRKKSTLPKR